MEWILKAIRQDGIQELKFGNYNQQDKLKQFIDQFKSHKFVTLSIGKGKDDA